MRTITLMFSLCLICVANGKSYLPVVMWHGMGDTCCLPFSLGSIKKLLEHLMPGVYVKSLKIGSSIIQDYESGYFIHPDRQVAMVCEQLNNDSLLANGYNAIGFSQGGQFLRAIAQRCPSPKMANLISMGGQHQGVFGLPNCPSISNVVCENFRRLLNVAAYTNFVQNHLVQATYWHDPLNELKYREFSSFIGEINNEHTINASYVENLQKLKSITLVKFTKDSMIQPRESSWFEFYEPGNDKQILALNASRVYERLGLKQLVDENKLHFIESEGNHLQFTDEWFEKNIVPILIDTIDCD